MWPKGIFKRSLTGFSSKFSFSHIGCHTKVEEYCFPHYLPIAEERIVKCIPFPSVLALCEMQTASSRFWTRAAISNDDKPDSKGGSHIYIENEKNSFFQ